MSNLSKTTLSYFKGIQGRVEIDKAEVIWSSTVGGAPVSTTRMGIFQAYELAKWLVAYVEGEVDFKSEAFNNKLGVKEDPNATQPL